MAIGHGKPSAKPGDKPKKKTVKKNIYREYLEAIVVAVLLTLVIRTFVIQAFRIPSGSMEDTLLIGDYLFVNKFLYGAKIPFTDLHLPAVRDPQAGDIIVFKYPQDPSRDFIKRTVGTPGDTLEIRDKQVYINGEPQPSEFAKFSQTRSLNEGYTEATIYPPGAGNKDNYGPVVVPPGHYFMMGDNRDHSDDSRYWGFLDRDLMKGKALFIYLSIDKNQPWWKCIRIRRFGKIIR